MKKWIALVVALVMALGCAAALADDEVRLADDKGAAVLVNAKFESAESARHEGQGRRVAGFKVLVGSNLKGETAGAFVLLGTDDAPVAVRLDRPLEMVVVEKDINGLDGGLGGEREYLHGSPRVLV